MTISPSLIVRPPSSILTASTRPTPPHPPPHPSHPSHPKVSPDEYLPYVTAFLRHHPSGTVFVATDSPAFLASIRERWPASNLKYRTDVLRDERNVAFARGRGGGQGGGSGRGYQKGEDVLLDMLLLSRCDWLLHAASGVAEFAIYFNPQLHERSVHLQYEHGRQRPPWMVGS